MWSERQSHIHENLVPFSDQGNIIAIADLETDPKTREILPEDFVPGVMGGQAFVGLVIMEKNVPRQTSFHLQALVGLTHCQAHAFADIPVALEPHK
jgi:hypothetical protein